MKFNPKSTLQAVEFQTPGDASGQQAKIIYPRLWAAVGSLEAEPGTLPPWWFSSWSTEHG